MIGKSINLAQVVTFSYSSFMAILTGIMIYLISRRILKIPLWASLFASLVYMYGSTSWSYAVTLYQHQTTAFLILSAFYAAWYFKERKRFNFLAALYIGLAFAVAILIDYPNTLFFAPVMVYFAVSASNIKQEAEKIRLNFRFMALLSLIPFILISAFHLYYNSSNFGSILRVSGSLTGYKTIIERNLDTTNPEAIRQIDILQSQKNPVSFFSEQKFIFGIYTLLFSPDRGLFLYSPIFILAIFGIILAIKNLNPEISTLIATVGTIFFLYGSWGDPWGGWAFGPRYLIPALSILVIFIALLLTKVDNLLLKFIVLMLFEISSAVSI